MSEDQKENQEGQTGEQTEAPADEQPETPEGDQQEAQGDDQKAGGKKEEKAADEKPLEKMTAKELREVAKDIQGITGVHGMNKEELVSAVKQARGIAEDDKKKTGSNRELKQKIRALQAKRKEALESKDSKMATIYKRKISRLKKKTRRAA
jgi:hypothetical protein